jgi:hypothetical protein
MRRGNETSGQRTKMTLGDAKCVRRIIYVVCRRRAEHSARHLDPLLRGRRRSEGVQHNARCPSERSTSHLRPRWRVGERSPRNLMMLGASGSMDQATYLQCENSGSARRGAYMNLGEPSRARDPSDMNVNGSPSDLDPVNITFLARASDCAPIDLPLFSLPRVPSPFDTSILLSSRVKPWIRTWIIRSSRAARPVGTHRKSVSSTAGACPNGTVCWNLFRSAQLRIRLKGPARVLAG